MTAESRRTEPAIGMRLSAVLCDLMILLLARHTDWMNSGEMFAAFEAELASRGLTATTFDAESLVALMFDFYTSSRITDADLDGDGDMLLFEWGTYDWGSGHGPSFQYCITRQVITSADDIDDQEMLRLCTRVHYAPCAETEELGSGSRWCPRPEAADDVRAWLLAVDATAFALATPPGRSEAYFGPI
jgi:hypothetical protein